MDTIFFYGSGGRAAGLFTLVNYGFDSQYFPQIQDCTDNYNCVID